MSDFWDYNMQKLQEQPKAKIVVELLRKYFEEKYPMKWKRLD
jgi:hypothetical protein